MLIVTNVEAAYIDTDVALSHFAKLMYRPSQRDPLVDVALSVRNVSVSTHEHLF